MPIDSPLPPAAMPARMCRDEVCYRDTASRRWAGAVSACGFLRKPRTAHGQKDIVYDRYVTVYVLRGTGIYEDARLGTVPLAAGSLVQRFPGRRHSTLPDGDGRWAECFLDLHPDFFHALAGFGSLEAERPVLRPGLDLSLVLKFEAILHDLRHAPERDLPRTALRAHELLVDLHEAARAAEGRGSVSPEIEAACRMLADDPAGRTPLPAVAVRCRLGYERFRKRFREETGLSPGEYRIRRRIDRARALLTEERLSVKETAAALGYPDVYGFSRQFKRVVGRSPSSFRRAMGVGAA